MQVLVEVKQGLQRNIHIEVSNEEIVAQYKSKLLDVAKKVKLDGFRPGKASTRAVEQKHGKQVRAEVVEEKIRESLGEAIKENNLRPAGPPNVDISEDGFGDKPLKFSAEFEIFPDVKLDKLKDISVEHPQAIIDDKLINETLDKVRKQVGGWEETQRGAENDDLLNIDYELQTEELPHDQKHGHNFGFILGAGQMIKGFDEQLIGAKAEDRRTLDVVFPEDYHEKKLAGQPMKIDVTVHKVSEKRLATDEEVSKAYNLPNGTIEDIKAKIRDVLETQIKEASRVKMKEQLLNQLLSLHPIQLPEILVKQEEELLKTHQLQLLEAKIREQEAKGVSIKDALDLVAAEEAKRKVALSMLLGEYIRLHEIKPDNQRVFETVQEITRGHERPLEMTKWFFEKEERIQSIVSFVLEEQAVDGMLEEVNHQDKETTYDELMA